MLNKEIVTVFHNDIEVGKLGWLDDRSIIFQYAPSWVENGFPLSPFCLDLNYEVYNFKNLYELEGISGCFYDSLPDQWSYILLKKYLKKKGVDYDSLNTLEKLTYRSKNGIGSLNYYPCRNDEFNSLTEAELDEIFFKTQRVLNEEEILNFDQLFALGSSSGGSRPKIDLLVNGENYIIKFPNSHDMKNMGKMEYDYMSTAKKCGINVPNIKLFPSKICSGYFGIKRFDIVGKKKRYVISLSSLVNKNPFTTVFTYKSLFKITSIMTNSCLKDLEQLYRIMVFNYLSNNQDDHAKNFSFIYNEDLRKWELSPAYDLTLSHTQYGEHQILVGDKGSNVSKEDLISEATGFGLKKDFLIKIYDEIKEIVESNLKNYITI